jgi:hypothetical protein
MRNSACQRQPNGRCTMMNRLHASAATAPLISRYLRWHTPPLVCVCLSFPVNYFTLLTAATININCIQMTTTTIHHSKYNTQTALNMTRRRAPKHFSSSFKIKEDEEQRAFIIGEADKFDTCIVYITLTNLINALCRRIMRAHACA